VVEVNPAPRIEDLGTIRYRDAWDLQKSAHAEVLAGGDERIFLVEHPPVITFGRRPGVDQHLLASRQTLASMGVEVVQSDRGGDITFHGLGQLVVYPIIRLNDHRLSVGSYVRSLETAVIATLSDLGIAAQKDSAAIGVWVDPEKPAKICALGVRIRRGISLHGIALNVTTDLSYFDLIVPCGLVGRPVTSIQQLLGAKTPSMNTVKQALAKNLLARIDASHP
jgi:lipoate-protein ligase B